MRPALALVFLLCACAAPPSRIEDGALVPAPSGYWAYCDTEAKKPNPDPICSYVKR